MTISEYIEWQDTPEGKAANLSRIHVTYKDILFMEWNTQVMKAERAASRCKMIASNMINLVNDTLVSGKHDLPVHTWKHNNSKHAGAQKLS
jgi:hypothetical protein